MKKILTMFAAVVCGGVLSATPTLSVVDEELTDDGVLSAVILKVEGCAQGYYRLLACYGFSAGAADSTNGWESVDNVTMISSDVDSLRVPVPAKWDGQVRHLRFMLGGVSDLEGMESMDKLTSASGTPVPLGFQVSPSMVLEMKFRYSTYGGGVFIGINNTTDKEDWRVFRYSNNIYLDVPGNDSGEGARLIGNDWAPNVNTDYVYEIGNRYIKDITNGGDSTLVSGDYREFTLNGDISFFSSTDYGTVYYLKVWDGSKQDSSLVHHFVPAKYGDYEGLYDVVGGKFYSSGTTKEFAVSIITSTDQFDSEKTLADPVAEIVSLACTGATSVGGKLDITWLGQVEGRDANACSFTVKYTNFLPTLAGSAELVNATGAGEYDFSITGLAPGGSYTAQLYADNGSGEIALGEPFTFNTPASIGGTIADYVGLWSRRVSDSWNDGGTTDWSDTVMGVSAWNGNGTGDDAGKFERRREIGALEAYAVDDGFWDVLEPAGKSVHWVGGGTSTICTLGYMWFDAGVIYKFRANNVKDHNSFVLVDNAVGGDIARTFTEDQIILRKEGAGSLTADYVTEATGWHLVKLVKGRTYSNQGSTPDDGFLFSSDGGANWKKIIDPGDGSFLRVNCAEMLELTAISRVDAELRGTLAADARIAGWELYACMAAEFEGTDFTAWTAVTLGDAVATAGESRDFAVTLADGAKYFRLAAVKRGEGDVVETVCWSKPVAIGELSTIDSSRPAVELRSVTAVSVEGATLAVNVINSGRQGACELVVVLDPEGDNPSVTNRFAGLEVGARTVTVSGLAPNRKYAVTVQPVAGEVEGEVVGPLSFTTDDSGKSWSVGLWQAKRSGSSQSPTFGVDVMAVPRGTGADQRTRQLGPAAAFVLYTGGSSGTWENPFDPGTNSGWKNNDTFGYEGYVYLRQGQYQFRYNVDDGVLLAIDGRNLAEPTTDNKTHTVSYFCASTGWYPIHIELTDGVGNAGGNEGVNSFVYNYNGLGWVQFADLGDGSLFRCLSHLELPVRSYRASGDAFSAELASDSSGAETFKLASGDEPRVYASEWTRCVAASGTGLSISASYDGARYLRLYGYNADGVEVAASDVLYVAPSGAPQLSTRIAADGSVGDKLTVSVDVLSLGSGAAADLKLMLSTSSDMSGAVAAVVEQVSAVGPVVRTIGEGIVPGTVYYCQAVLTGADGCQDVIPVVPVEARGVSRLAAGVSASNVQWNGVFSGTLEYLGAGETTVYLLTGEDPDSMEVVDSVRLTAVGEFSMACEFPYLNRTVSYAFRVVNGSSSEVWTNMSQTASIALVDAAKYYWNPAVPEGAWTEHANWTDENGDALDPRCAYPNSAKCTADFSKCTEAVTVLCSGTNDVCELKSDKAVTIVFRAAAPGAWINGRKDYPFSFVSGSDVTFDGVFAWSQAYFRPEANTSWHFVNPGAGYSAGNETWMTTDGSFVEVKDGAHIDQRGWRYEMWASYTTLVVDNATYYGSDDVRLCKFNGAITNSIVFKGAAPKMTCSNMSSGIEATDDVYAELLFVVPEGGFGAEGVVCERGGGSYSDQAFANQGKKQLVFRLDRKSPAFLRGKTDTLLVEWSKGIATDKVVLAPSPRTTGSLYYVYGWKDGHTAGLLEPENDGDLPTGIRARFAAGGFAVMIR